MNRYYLTKFYLTKFAAFIEQLRDCYENFVRWRSGNVNEVLTVLSQCDYNIDVMSTFLKFSANNPCAMMNAGSL